MRVAPLLCLLGLVQAGLRIHKATPTEDSEPTSPALEDSEPTSPAFEDSETTSDDSEDSSAPVDGQVEEVDGVEYLDEGEKDFDDAKAMDKAVLKDEQDWDNKVKHDMQEEEKETGEEETPGIVWTSAVEETWPGETAEEKKKVDDVMHAQIKNLQLYGNPFKPTPELLKAEKAEKMAEGASDVQDELEPESASPPNASLAQLSNTTAAEGLSAIASKAMGSEEDLNTDAEEEAEDPADAADADAAEAALYDGGDVADADDVSPDDTNEASLLQADDGSGDDTDEDFADAAESTEDFGEDDGDDANEETEEEGNVDPAEDDIVDAEDEAQEDEAIDDESSSYVMF